MMLSVCPLLVHRLVSNQLSMMSHDSMILIGKANITNFSCKDEISKVQIGFCYSPMVSCSFQIRLFSFMHVIHGFLMIARCGGGVGCSSPVAVLVSSTIVFAGIALVPSDFAGAGCPDDGIGVKINSRRSEQTARLGSTMTSMKTICDFGITVLLRSHNGLISRPSSRSKSPWRKNSSINSIVQRWCTFHFFAGCEMSQQCNIYDSALNFKSTFVLL